MKKPMRCEMCGKTTSDWAALEAPRLGIIAVCSHHHGVVNENEHRARQLLDNLLGTDTVKRMLGDEA